MLAVSTAIAPRAGGSLLHGDLVLVAAGGLVLLFALWWIYFLKPAVEVLDRRRDLGFWWGYGHFGVFAALAALGAGLQVAAERAQHAAAAGGSDAAVALAVAIPVVAFLLLVWALHAPVARVPRRDGAVVALVAAGVLAVAGACAAGLPLPWAVALMAVPPWVLPVLAVLNRTGGIAG